MVSAAVGLLLPTHHCKQCRDVKHHCLHAKLDRTKSSQPQQIENCWLRRGHRISALAAVRARVLSELTFADGSAPSIGIIQKAYYAPFDDK
jgi:hypothetical protein